jgi:hypothetical protein
MHRQPAPNLYCLDCPFLNCYCLKCSFLLSFLDYFFLLSFLDYSFLLSFLGYSFCPSSAAPALPAPASCISVSFTIAASLTRTSWDAASTIAATYVELQRSRRTIAIGE